MADPVPVCDVLCEATEYLSKLGSNLRMRTDNLKHKRIRKDKLKNAHAVQKAVNKVLLICELSKKSIENVETGVKKILAQIGANQAEQDDEKTNKSTKSKNTDKYEYFIFDSRRLKIRKKINLKHYLSSKVVSNRISTEILDKYPVYENCKLYRARRRSKKSIESVNESLPDKCEANDDLLSKSTSDCTENFQTEDKSQSLELNVLDSSIIEIDSSFNESSIKESINKDKTCGFKDKHRKSIESELDSKEQDDETNSEYKNESAESIKVSQNQGKEKDLKDSEITSKEDVLESTAQVKEGELENKRRKSDESKIDSEKQETSETIDKDTQLTERSIAEDEGDSRKEDNFKKDSKYKKNAAITKKSTSDCKKKYKNIKPIDESSDSSKEDLTTKEVNETVSDDNKEDTLDNVISSDNCNSGSLNINVDTKIDHCKKDKSSSKKKYKHIKAMDESSDSNSTGTQNNKRDDKIIIDCKKDESSTKKKYKHIKSMDDSSDSNREEVHSNKEGENKTMDDSQKVESLSKKKYKHIKTMVENSDNTTDEICGSGDTILNANMDSKENKIDKAKTISIEKNANSSSDDEGQNKIKANAGETTYVSSPTDEKTVSEKVESKTEPVSDTESCAKSQTSVTKPLIKCVSLAKLLKEDLIQKKNDSLIEIIDSESEDDSHKNKKNKNAHKTKQGSFKNKPRHTHKSNEKTRKKQDSSNSDSEDKLYWIQKRKEVKKFKAKQFDINITRLPKFTENYLIKCNLKRIVQNELVLCEIGNLSNKNNDKSCDESKVNKTFVTRDTRNHKKNKEQPKSDVSLAKNELLNDSDSDKSTKEVIAEAVKQALLNDSDSDKQKENDNDISLSPLRNLCECDHNKSGNQEIEVNAEGEVREREANNTNIESKNKHGSSEEPDSEKQANKSIAKETEKSAQPSREDEDKSVNAKANLKSRNNLRDIKESLLNNSDSDCENQSNKVDITNEKQLPSTNLNMSDNEVDKAVSNDTESKQSDQDDSDNTNKSVSKGSTVSERKTSLKSDIDTQIDNNEESKLLKDSQNIDQTKSSLLKDSSDELKTSNSKRKRSKSESVSPSKRKHIMESMHAKKMLLTYSSSSDTDDEQLKNVLKEIRDSLLKGSDDEKKKSDKSVSESEVDSKKSRRKLKCKEHKKTSDEESSQSRTNKRSNSSAKEMSSSSSKKVRRM